MYAFPLSTKHQKLFIIFIKISDFRQETFFNTRSGCSNLSWNSLKIISCEKTKCIFVSIYTPRLILFYNNFVGCLFMYSWHGRFSRIFPIMLVLGIISMVIVILSIFTASLETLSTLQVNISFTINLGSLRSTMKIENKRFVGQNSVIRQNWRLSVDFFTVR